MLNDRNEPIPMIENPSLFKKTILFLKEAILIIGVCTLNGLIGLMGLYSKMKKNAENHILKMAEQIRGVTIVTCRASEDNYHLIVSINGQEEEVDIRDQNAVDDKIFELEELMDKPPVSGADRVRDMLVANRKND